MVRLSKIFHFLNPIDQFGKKNYSVIFPFLVTILALSSIELTVQYILKDPSATGLFAIFIPIALIIYFAFRDGVRGGVVTVFLTLLYYAYIIHSRDVTPEQRMNQYETASVLGLVYLLLAFVIGWLRQTIDSLIEREANEKIRLSAIIEQLPVGILIADEKGNIIQGNKQIEKILGRKMRSNLKAGEDTLIKSLRNGKQVEPKQWPLAKALSSGRAIPAEEFYIDDGTGHKAHLSISAAAIHNQKRKIIAAASIISDITAQKEMEERKDDFVNMASHELKTPITSMTLYIDFLNNRLRSQKDEKIQSTMKNLKTQTLRLQNLVNDLLDVSRLQTGKLRFQKERFRLDELVENSINELKESANNQKIVFAKKSPIAVEADQFRIYQVITNFITNAIKYSPEGSNIVISVTRTDGKAVVSVKDQGIGIDKEHQKKIFDRLYQATGSTDKTYPGLGMGLYIAKEIIRKHRGKIWVESEKGKGSTFYFSLPLQRKSKKK